MKWIAALLALSLTACETAPAKPPVAVQVKVAVPVPCKEPEPACQVPAYDAAKKEQPMDDRVKLFRAEAIEQADCLRLYRAALERCRAPIVP